MARPDIYYCDERNKHRFERLVSILITFIIIASVGIFIFLYFLIGNIEASNLNATLYEIDSTNPPYISIFFFAILLLSIIALVYTLKLKSHVCP